MIVVVNVVLTRFTQTNNVLAGGAEGLIIYNHVSFYDRYIIPSVTYPAPTFTCKMLMVRNLLNWLSTGQVIWVPLKQPKVL